MGRRAKHFTAQAKISASRISSHKWDTSAHGQEIRRMAYLSSHSRKQPNRLPQLVPIPKRLQELAQKPLPASDLFQQAARDPDAVDESDLPVWDHAPPYASAPPPETEEEARFTRNLVDVMHGRRLRVSKVRRRARMEVGMRIAVGELREMLAVQLREHLDNWMELDALVGEYEDCERHLMMAQNLLQWSARETLQLRVELEAARGGLQSYTDLYHSYYTQ
ncbi:hypothetical protein HWV62_18426 [Athelia sp. TMB]|nr:hypothetical protein HWV62_18426 [Athelia sp. TMB]